MRGGGGGGSVIHSHYSVLITHCFPSLKQLFVSLSGTCIHYACYIHKVLFIYLFIYLFIIIIFCCAQLLSSSVHTNTLDFVCTLGISIALSGVLSVILSDAKSLIGFSLSCVMNSQPSLFKFGVYYPERVWLPGVDNSSQPTPQSHRTSSSNQVTHN